MADEKEQKPQKPTPGRPGADPVGPKMSRGVTSWLILVGMLIMLVVLLNQGERRTEITLDQFLSHVENGDIEKLAIRERIIQGKFKPSQGDKPGADGAFEVLLPRGMVTYDFIADLRKNLPDAEIESKQESLWMVALMQLLPWLLIFAFIWFVVIRQLRNAGGGPGGMFGSFGRSRHRITNKEHTAVRFTDVAGIAEAKEEVFEVVEFLRNPKKFQRLGGRIPRGVLLIGLPGCGKTLLAKAIAGEADVPFFSISGSDFVEMFVGVGASRVRDLFKQAKENSPCIIFLDEIDAVGRRRGANFGGGGHDEREQTLNAILVEMDGFDTSDQVIVIAATNRVDVLDPALIRPGRFDRQVSVPNPDLQGRFEILKVHARKIKMGPTVDMRRLARGTPMFSGADLAAIINEAALIATMANKDFVEQEDLEEARDKVRWGRAHKSRKVDEQDQKIVAYHEAGHALIQALEKHADPIHKVSIIPRGPMGGATFSLPERDRLVYSSAYLKAMLRVTLGGRLAEELFCGESSSGAASDIQQATEIVRNMVMRWGMSEKIGFLYCEGESNPFEIASRQYSEATAADIDAEVRRMLNEAYAETKAIMLEYKEQGQAIADALLKYETLSGDEVNAVIRGESLDRPTVTDLLGDAMPDDVGKARPVRVEETKPDVDLDNGGTSLPQPG